MRYVKNHYSLLVFLSMVLAGSVSAQTAFTGSNRAVMSQFERNVKDYVKLREKLEGRLPKLPKKATPEQIETHKAAHLKLVQSARSRAKHGDIFTAAASAIVRGIIKNEFQGRERRDLRTAVFEAETKGVPIRVNAAYPEAKELLEMPPSLLLALPQLPKQIRYRFVGTNLLLVDRENNLIIDYLTNALP